MKSCHECGAPMKATKKWKSKVNPRNAKYHRITRYECTVCEYIETAHGSQVLDQHHENAAVEEAQNALRQGIEPPIHTIT